MKFRKEFDSIGSIKVQTIDTGALQHKDQKYFDIGDFLVRPVLIKSIAIIKKAQQLYEKNKEIYQKSPGNYQGIK